MLLHGNTNDGIPSLFCSAFASAASGPKANLPKPSTATMLSNVATLLNDFILSFTNDTWGLTLTLPDFPVFVAQNPNKEVKSKVEAAESNLNVQKLYEQ